MPRKGLELTKSHRPQVRVCFFELLYATSWDPVFERSALCNICVMYYIFALKTDSKQAKGDASQAKTAEQVFGNSRNQMKQQIMMQTFKDRKVAMISQTLAT